MNVAHVALPPLATILEDSCYLYPSLSQQTNNILYKNRNDQKLCSITVHFLVYIKTEKTSTPWRKVTERRAYDKVTEFRH